MLLFFHKHSQSCSLYLCWDCGWLFQPVSAVSVRWPGTEGTASLSCQSSNLRLPRRRSNSTSPTNHCIGYSHIKPDKVERRKMKLLKCAKKKKKRCHRQKLGASLDGKSRIQTVLTLWAKYLKKKNLKKARTHTNLILKN